MIVVPSRFAGLRIVEDDFVAAKTKAAKKAEAANKANGDKSKKITGDKTKVKQINGNKNSQDRPGSSIAAHNGHSERKKKKKNPNNAQWEEWKQKDAEIVDEKFNDDLLQAIKLSSLEYDSQVTNGQIIQTDPKPETKDKECGKKNKKNKTLTLGQFREMCETENIDKEELPRMPSFEQNLFENLEKEALIELERNKALEKKKLEKEKKLERTKIEKHLERKPPSLEEIKQSQLNCTLEEKDLEISQLKEQMEKMEAELILVKTRNKKLCSIIGQGEMKAKANLLIEMEEVKEVHAELNSEVERLNAQLQQERSRCTCAHRQDKKKRPTADV